MTCYHPVKAFKTPTGVVFKELARHDIIGDIELPCGRCIGCRLRRAQEWATRITHEAQCWDRNAFVTLTYEQNPYTLNHAHYQAFMRRLRHHAPQPVRFFMCGEYGETTGRPHYHACLFNVDFDDRTPHGTSQTGHRLYTSPTLTRLWGHGHATTQTLCHETALYAARYCVDKITGDLAEDHYRVTTEEGEIINCQPEYSKASNRPGIGATWFSQYHGDVYPHDRIIHEGKEYKPPRYYDKLFKRQQSKWADQVEYNRQRLARMNPQDQTPERLATRETVTKAKHAFYKRDAT